MGCSLRSSTGMPGPRAGACPGRLALAVLWSVGLQSLRDGDSVPARPDRVHSYAPNFLHRQHSSKCGRSVVSLLGRPRASVGSRKQSAKERLTGDTDEQRSAEDLELFETLK